MKMKEAGTSERCRVTETQRQHSLFEEFGVVSCETLLKR